MSRLRRAVLASALAGVETPEAGVALRRFCFGPDFLGFQGHFPGYPVLPALVQVLAAATVAEALLGRPLPLERVEHAKFRLLVEPGEEVAVRCARRPGDRPVVDARVLVGRGLASDFRLTFGGGGFS